jgi:hypothetical protein
MPAISKASEPTFKLRAAEVRRPRSNLLEDHPFMLPKEKRNNGFLGVFNWAYSGDPRRTLIKVLLSPLMNMSSLGTKSLPAARGPDEKKQRRSRNKQISEWEEKRQDNHLAQYTTLKKVNDGDDSHFLLALPVMQWSSVEALDSILLMFDGATLTDQAKAAMPRGEPDKVMKKTYPADQILPNAGLREDALKVFQQSCVGVCYAQSGNFITGFVEFKIMKDEAQYMTGTEWLQLRPVDLYPLFTSWVEAEYVSKQYGKTSMSISKIAKTLPPYAPGDERVDKYNITVNMSGEPLWIPKDCDNTQRYESEFSAAATHEQEFALRRVGQQDNPVLPVNIPILTDWVNNKFTYSSTVGKPVLMDLIHFRKFNASMAMNVMKRDMPSGYIKNLSFYARQCSLSLEASAYGAQIGKLRAQDNIVSWADAALQKFFSDNHTEHIRYYDIMASVSEPDHWYLAPLAKFIKALQPAMVQNIEAMYVKYAVITITEALGLLSVLSCYGSDIGGTTAEANQINKPAIDQGVDPNWTPPPIPLLTKKFEIEGNGFLPHQFKVRNIMRGRPDNAAWPIDAGGGKSMLTITDILYEIEAGESAPYLVMCPAHLVANYVSELVEFTDGKVNVIPVTSYNYHTTGIKRFEQMLDTAPINTVLVIDYNCLKFREKKTVYGTTTITVYPVVEMIRRYKPGYVCMDESHMLRNVGRARFKSVMSLVADIKKKRIASGTMNPDSPSDLPGQMAILDPTVFGSRKDFNEKYGKEIKGGRVVTWNETGPNAVATVLPTLKQCIVWAPAKRKEWACALPPRRDRFIPVELTENQRLVYNAIFSDMIQQIKEKAQTDKKAKKLLDQLTGKQANPEDEEAFGDLGSAPPEDQTEGDEDDESEDAGDTGDDLGAALQPWLPDIERFCTNPAWHPYAKNGFKDTETGRHVPPLRGDDLRSPKAVELERLLREYLSTSEHKILVFTNYEDSTDALFNAMPKDLQDIGILYKTSFKTEFVNRFKTDKKIRWMVGIRSSLEVGLNLQVSSTLIRVEGVWTPGEQEQGDSRIARPDFGPNRGARKILNFDTIVADKTIDITKAARLRAKIVAIAKFDNPLDPNYQAIPAIPVLSMNLDNIQYMNDFSSNLAKYAHSMRMLNEVIENENKEEAKRIEAAGGFHMTSVKQGPLPAGAALMERVPYAQGTELYKASELGLVRVDNFIGLELSKVEEEEGADSGDDSDVVEDDSDQSSAQVERRRILKEQSALVMNRKCHTELGDGYIIATAGAKSGNFIFRLVVRFEDGSVGRNLRVTNVFIVTRTETNGVDMRNKLAEAAGLKVTAPITVPSFNTVQRRVTKREQDEIDRREAEKNKKDPKQKKLDQQQKDLKKGLNVDLQLELMNGYVRLSYMIGKNERAEKALEALGFRRDPSYVYTRIRHLLHLRTQSTKWLKAGFTMSKSIDNDTFVLLAEELSGNSIQSHRHYDRLIGAGAFRNYLRKEFKPSADKKVLQPFALVTDGGDTDPGALADYEKEGVNPRFGAAYLCLPYGPGHPSTQAAIQPGVKAPSSKWTIAPPALSIFCNNVAGVVKVLKQLKAAGIVIGNVDQLKNDASHFKLAQKKDDEHIDVRGDATPEDEDDEDAAPARKPVKKAKK